MIKSYFFTMLLTTAMIVLPVESGSNASSEKWDLPTGYPSDNFQTVNIQEFGKCLADGTDGSIEIVIHPNGVWIRAIDIKNAVQGGQVFIGERLLSAHERENPIYGTDAIPYLTNGYEQSVALYQSYKPELEKILEEQGLKLLYSVPWPANGIYFKNRVEDIKDLRGIKIRSYNSSTQRISELTGMVPIQIEAAETSAALEVGIIDSVITSPITGVDVKVWETLKYFYDMKTWNPRNYVIMNKDKYDSLSVKVKDVLSKCSARAEVDGIAKSIVANDRSIQVLKENGVTIVDPPERLKAEFEEIGKLMLKEWLKKSGSVGQGIIESYKKNRQSIVNQN